MLDVISLNSDTKQPGHIITCSNDFVVCNVAKEGKIILWRKDSEEKEAKVLVGHHHNVTAISLSYQPLNYLCSCSSDNVILWNLSHNEGFPRQGKVLMTNLHSPQDCCFSSCNSNIFIACDKEIIVLGLAEKICRWSLPTSCSVTLITSIWNENFISLDSDHFFKVWDMKSHDIIHKKHVSSGFPIAITVDNISRLIAVGTSTGELFLYGHNFNVIRSWRVWQILHHKIASFQEKKTYSGEFEDVINDFDSDDVDFPILALNLSQIPSSQNKTNLSRYFPNQSMLLVVTSGCFFVMDVNREELTFYTDFKNLNNIVGSCIGLIRAAAITRNSAFISLLPVISNKVIGITLPVNADNCQMRRKACEIDDLLPIKNISFMELSFMNCDKMEFGTSYLEFKLRNKSSKHAAQSKGSSTKPVTFHSKVKSSGYGTLHCSSMFQSSKTKVLKTPKSDEYAGFKISKHLVKNASICSKKPQLISKISAGNSVGVTSVKISGDSSYAACGTNSGVVEMLKLYPEKMKNLKSVSCHESAVTCINWSHSWKYYITSSSDQTCKVWSSVGQIQKPFLVFGSPKGQNSTRNAWKKSCSFESDVSHCQFYYVDHFILLSSRNVLYMYAYDVQYETNDLKRFNNQSCKQLVTSVKLDCQQITSFAAINQFFSNLVLCTGSLKSIDVVDMNVGKIVWHEGNISSKVPYAIVLNEGTSNIQQAHFMHDVFSTVSSDGVKMWDLRSKRSIMNYHEHCSRTVKCGVSFSPCGHYLAAGSEDKSIYIYDLRSTCCLYRLSDHAGIVTSVSFTASNSQLLGTSLNGIVYLYGSEAA